jgi:YesN/AraC family two-component response regulator
MSKTTIAPIAKNARYAEASVVLSRLEKSHHQAQAEADRTASLLAAWNPPQGTDAVSAALEMLDGKTPARNSMSLLETERATSQSKATILKQAIEQQRVAMAALASDLSSEESALHRAEHAEAVLGIAHALKALDVALEGETNVRERIEQAGYRCILPVFVIPEMGRLSHLDSPMVRHFKSATEYVADYDDDVSGQLDKQNTVHLLVDVPGIGRVSEIVSMAGRLARHLVRMGRAEETSDKPRRVVEPRRNREIVLE